MAAADPCKGLLSRHPAGSPERQAQIDACFAKKRAQKVKSGMKAKPTTTTRPSSEGTGGPNDPAWRGLANLAKNGLPG